MAELIAKHTGQSVAQIKEDSDRDKWYSSAEAKTYGFIDHVVTRASDVTGSGGTSGKGGK
jgi:ATP-dependent Clp protease protease subunit